MGSDSSPFNFPQVENKKMNFNSSNVNNSDVVTDSAGHGEFDSPLVQKQNKALPVLDALDAKQKKALPENPDTDDEDDNLHDFNDNDLLESERQSGDNDNYHDQVFIKSLYYSIFFFVILYES